MNRIFFSLVAIAVALASLPVSATPLDDKIAVLKKAVKDELASKPKNAASAAPANPMTDPRYLAASVDQIIGEAGNPSMEPNIEAQIRQLLAMFSSDAVQKAGNDLIDEMHKEQKAKADAAAAAIQDLLKRTSETVNAAKKPEDLDDLLVQLQKFQADRNAGYGYDSQTQGLYQQVTNAFEFVKGWQNYLLHSTTGQGRQAYQDLQGLSQNNSFVGIMPRSKILALGVPQTEQKTDEDNPSSLASQEEDILDGIHSTDDLEAACDKLRHLQVQHKMGVGFSADAYSFLRTYDDVKAGIPTNLAFNMNPLGQGGIKPEAKRALFLFVLQHYFTTYKGPPPTQQEDVSTYIEQVISYAANNKDWELLRKGLSAQNYLDQNSVFNRSSGNALTGLNALLTGMNQDEAGQYYLAMVSYENALKDLPSEIVSPKLIGDRLATIQKDHPDDYQKGMQIFNAPPQVQPTFYSSPYGTASYGRMPGYPGAAGYSGAPGYPGTPGYPMQPGRPNLNIPGATVPATATPTAPTPLPNPAPSQPSTNAAPVTPANPASSSSSAPAKTTPAPTQSPTE